MTQEEYNYLLQALEYQTWTIKNSKDKFKRESSAKRIREIQDQLNNAVVDGESVKVTKTFTKEEYDCLLQTLVAHTRVFYATKNKVKRNSRASKIRSILAQLNSVIVDGEQVIINNSPELIAARNALKANESNESNELTNVIGDVALGAGFMAFGAVKGLWKVAEVASALYVGGDLAQNCGTMSSYELNMKNAALRQYKNRNK